MKRISAILVLATVLIFPAKLFSAKISIEVETKTAAPGQSLYLRVLLHTDIPISALRIPITMENPWITLNRVSWDYTVARPYFVDTTLLSNTNRTDQLNVLPYIRLPIPTIPPPGGEICRLLISVDPFAPEQFVSVDSLNSLYYFVDASDQWGNAYLPDFISGGIWIKNEATAVDDVTIDIPADYALEQNYPNPFNPSTEIEFVLPRATVVILEVYDILGRKVTTLASGNFPAGRHRVEWDAVGSPSGVYFYHLATPERSFTRKMLLLQ